MVDGGVWHVEQIAACRLRPQAVDSRIENVAKTMVRTGFYGWPVRAFKCDVERPQDFASSPEADIVHHIGVLYRLKDPDPHLLALGRLAKLGLMLDTQSPRSATSGMGRASCSFPPEVDLRLALG
jgi:hypothetical protein